MAEQTWVQCINPYQISSTGTFTLKEFTTIKPLSPGGEKAETGALVIPPNTFQPGSLIRVTAGGFMETEAEETEYNVSLQFGKPETTYALGGTKKAKTEKSLKTSWYLTALVKVLTSTEAEAKGLCMGELFGFTKGAVPTNQNPIPFASGEAEVETTEWAVKVAGGFGKESPIFLAATCSKSAAKNLITCNLWVVETLN